MTGGSLTSATTGPLFYVTNSTGDHHAEGCEADRRPASLVKAAAGNWGTSGSNGGTVVLTADGQTLTGNVVADTISSITLTSRTARRSRSDKHRQHGQGVCLTLDSSSTWTVTADSYLTSLTGAVSRAPRSPTSSATATPSTTTRGTLRTAHWAARRSLWRWRPAGRTVTVFVPARAKRTELYTTVGGR